MSDELDAVQRIMEIMGYDPERKSFSMREYVLHGDLSGVVRFINEVDLSGKVSLIYLASLCTEYVKQLSVNVADLLEDPSIIEPFRELKAIVSSDVVRGARASFEACMLSLIARVGGTHLIGREGLRDVIEESIRPVVKEFRGLNFEAYMKSSSPICMKDVRMSRKIFRFGSLGECLLTLEGLTSRPYASFRVPGAWTATSGSS